MRELYPESLNWEERVAEQTENMTARTNPPLDTGPSSPSVDCDNSPLGVMNEPARKSGSLQSLGSRTVLTESSSSLPDTILPSQDRNPCGYLQNVPLKQDKKQRNLEQNTV
ncbi:hypothetical protein T03_5834 [Trichinella britovi]|uniref:Uncharacterized protein n=1 Tax=Trichinella britovi TaxID=45882 RepID=A0A0V1CA94_TRIBR|nr:hypothetical protein T03_5834 [Trichinella britovi]